MPQDNVAMKDYTSESKNCQVKFHFRKRLVSTGDTQRDSPGVRSVDMEAAMAVNVTTLQACSGSVSQVAPQGRFCICTIAGDTVVAVFRS
jgi:hypothetical protein